MKILVAIANYGTKNDHYLQRLLDEYASMPYDVHIVLLCNVPKSFGDQVEVIVQRAPGKPWSFPFPHKRIFADRVNDYDLFIYSEDDTLVTQNNIEAFLRVTQTLPPNDIAGFLRYETAPDGSFHYSTVHGHFHWDPQCITSVNGYTFAYFTNHHAACYLLTQAQLKKALASRGFLVAPHEERYDLLVTAATDPYTQCGFRKVICISHLRDFVLRHLSNKNLGKLGLPETGVIEQVRALESIHKNQRPAASLLNVETRLKEFKWSKSYYESPSPEVMALIPKGAKKILSYGCGWGAMEAGMKKRGLRVTAIPLDAVIGASAESKGIEVVYGDSRSALAKVAGERFDCVLFSNVLHLVPQPAQLLSDSAKVMAPGASIIATVPNLSQITVRWRRITHDSAFQYERLGSFERTGVHVTSFRKIHGWFADADLVVQKVLPIIPKRGERLSQFLGRLGDAALAEEFIFVGGKA